MHCNLRKCPGVLIFSVHVGQLPRSFTHISVEWLWTCSKIATSQFLAQNVDIYFSPSFALHFTLWNAHLKKIWGESTKVFIEFIFFLILKRINHRGRVWCFFSVSQSDGAAAALPQFSRHWSVVKWILALLSQHILLLKVKKLESISKEKQKWQDVCTRHSFTYWETNCYEFDVN